MEERRIRSGVIWKEAPESKIYGKVPEEKD
jgi:hypothetical protein